MYIKFQYARAFTLIEMLIVIVIIGILASALIPRLQSVQERARDTKRKTDISQIYNSLQILFLDNGQYPLGTNTSQTCVAYNANCRVTSMTGSSSPWIAALSGVMTTIPVDPVNRSLQGNLPYPYYDGSLFYAYGTVYNSPVHNFDLLAQLENKLDPLRCGVKAYQGGGYPLGDWCFGGGLSKQLFQQSPLNGPY